MKYRIEISQISSLAESEADDALDETYIAFPSLF